MGEISGTNGFADSGAIETVGKIVVIAIALLLFVVVFAFCLHIYARWALNRRRETESSTTARRRSRFDFAGGRRVEAVAPPGLDPSVLKTIPITVFSRQENSKDGTFECAVCLGEVSAGEKVRVLPDCRHGFHVDCIDTWFKSRRTCPICRNLLSKPKNGVSDSGGGDVIITAADSASSAEEDCDRPSSSSSPPSTAVAIDIPRHSAGEELKSPVPTRLKSLKRLFSGNSRRVSSVSSPRNLDEEQQGSSEDKADSC